MLALNFQGLNQFGLSVIQLSYDLLNRISVSINAPIQVVYSVLQFHDLRHQFVEPVLVNTGSVR